MKDLLGGIFWLVAALTATTYYVAITGRLVWVALRTGRLQSQGVVYDRGTQPKRYWFLIVACVVMGLIFIFTTVLYSVGFVRHWLA
jgi:hypothetical protein